ncbi:unnamed protein product [Rhizoctonia solani]|uniref:CHAT domain-containing protein n=1 Tax=Rhizoctonia solani TaxID=456999 RepID=A0A8H3CRW7_9AGAM|nr:unnamed protein product [Rhizoctonia solani]
MVSFHSHLMMLSYSQSRSSLLPKKRIELGFWVCPIIQVEKRRFQRKLDSLILSPERAAANYTMSETSKSGTDLSDVSGEAQSNNLPNQALEQDMKIEGEPGSPVLECSDLSPQDLYNQGISYRNRFQRFGVLKDIEKAIECGARALDLTPDGDPGLPLRLAGLGSSYIERFWRLGELDDLAKSIDYRSRALQMTPEGDPDLARRHANLGVSRGTRFQRLGQLDDLDKAIEHQSRALALTPDGDPELSSQHANLGVAYGTRFRHLGQLSDFEKSLEHRSCALELTPDGHPDLSSRHASLGMAYTDRFRRLGELNDLEKSIEHDYLALVLTPDGHPDMSRRHADLGMDYTDRFQRLGELDDLEKSMKHHSRALELTPDDHPVLSNRHVDLGVAYGNRFRHLGQLDDLEKSIEHRSRALELTPDGHPHLSGLHASLGVAYTDRFERLGELGDLEKSIEHDSLALTLTPEGHPDLSSRHAGLAVSYGIRFEQLGQLNDHEKSIEHHSRALELTPDGHPELSIRYFNQAESYFNHYHRTTNPSSLQHSLDSFRRASQVSTGAPRVIFQLALQWAALASKNPSLQCIEAYQAAIDLLPQFIWLGATTSQRYTDLSIAENLAINAAFAAILDSNPNLALEWVEHARCVVWNQSIMLRSPLDQLHSFHPDLAVRVEAVAKQLSDASSESPTSQSPTSSSVDPEQVGQQRRRLAMEYSDLLAQTRKLPGFEDFLQPMRANALVHAARNGPIVVINCHKDYCDSLLILPGNDDIKHLPLPNFNQEKAQNARSELEISLRRKGLRQRGFKVRLPPGYKDGMSTVLLDLWKHVVEPVIDFLGLKNDISVHTLPHITWCPTGALSFLPLHAAGDYDQPQSRVFNYAISSYTPTLTALLASTPSSFSHASRVLAIGQAKTPGHTPLPGTTRELECLRAHTSNKVEYSQLLDNQATTAAVLDAMEQHDWVHLACHAHQNVKDPTKSGFFLHDGTLDLASINRRSFKNKGLAFLSACQTATGDERLPDEAIHLASGMLMAGYPSVIATMWSVMDRDAPFVADKVYERLMKEGKVGNGEAGKALHYAVAALRDEVGEKEFGRWVPYIHIGS